MEVQDSRLSQPKMPRPLQALTVKASFVSSIPLRGEGSASTVVVVADNFRRGIRFIPATSPQDADVLCVDSVAFEKDVSDGVLGEAAAIHLLLPVAPIKGEDYIRQQGRSLRKRVVLDCIQNVILDYQYLASEVLIEPSYFFFDSMLRRSKLYYPLRTWLLSHVKHAAAEEGTQQVAHEFSDAVEELKAEGLLKGDARFVQVNEDYVERTLRRRFHRLDAWKPLERALRSQVAQSFAGALKPLAMAREVFLPLAGQQRMAGVGGDEFDPKRFMMLPTKRGFVALSNEATIEEFIEKETSLGRKCAGVRKLGGVLNNVYLIEFHPSELERTIVAKKFEQWADLKWGALAIWAVGAHNFSVQAKTRMARECSALRFLKRSHIAVPEILHISWDKAIVFLEHVEGQALDAYIAGWMKNGKVEDEGAAIVSRAGETLAAVHSVNMAVGDFKPENLIVKPDGSLCLVDLEQSERGGNKHWDLAEFLFFAAHYAWPTTPGATIRRILRGFLEGYVKGGGSCTVVGKVMTPGHLKAFTAFVLPRALYHLSWTCRDFVKSMKC